MSREQGNEQECNLCQLDQPAGRLGCYMRKARLMALTPAQRQGRRRCYERPPANQPSTHDQTFLEDGRLVAPLMELSPTPPVPSRFAQLSGAYWLAAESPIYDQVGCFPSTESAAH